MTLAQRRLLCIGGWADGVVVGARADKDPKTFTVTIPYDNMPPFEWTSDLEPLPPKANTQVYTFRRLALGGETDDADPIEFLALHDMTNNRALAQLVMHYQPRLPNTAGDWIDS